MNKIDYPYRIRLPGYLGKAIKDTRKSKGMTQKNLADLTGTSVKFISDVERGKNTAQTDKVFDLLRALGLIVYVTQAPLPENKGDIQ
jgi:y4mF family transcriptional regulator